MFWRWSVLVLISLVGGCSDRVIESGRFGCSDDSDCLWGWRCLRSETGKVCVDLHDVDAAAPDTNEPIDSGVDKPPTPGICGDGRRESDEQCDVGALNSELPDAPCRPDCKQPRCGDGIQDSGEQCDGGDDCNACKLTNSSALLVHPPMVHFGAYGVGCEAPWVNRALTLINSTNESIELKRIVPSGPSCGGVSIDAEGRTLAPGSEVEFVVSLKVASTGLRNCVLRVETSDGVLQVPVTAEIATSGTRQVDRFVQHASRRVDILMAIDPSGSMHDERLRLMATTKTFASGSAKGKLDFHLGSFAITEPDVEEDRVLGQLHGDPRFITGQSENLEDEFKTRIEVAGSGAVERGFEAIVAALGPWLSRTVDPEGCATCEAPDICAAGACRGHNWGFRRSDASIEVLVLTDEDDGSALAAAEVRDFLKSLVNPLLGQSVRVHALLPESGCICSACEEAPKWEALNGSTGGVLFDLCSEDFAPAIEAITDRIFGLSRQFFLLRKPEPAAGIEVTIDGLPSTGFDYDPNANAITFTIPPPDRAQIEVRYEVSCREASS